MELLALAQTAHPELPLWVWAAFLAFVAFVLALDLGVFNREAKKPSFRAAVAWCIVWISLAVGFGFLLSALRDPLDAQLFAAGYLLELALSVDNLFIFILVFAHFKIPEEHQHRVLFWGIIGAVVMRAVFIIAGIAAVERFTILLPIFGAFLIFTGFKLATAHGEDEGKDMAENLFVRMARKVFPLTPHLHGSKFMVRENGRTLFTPLFVVLLVVEGTDLVFAIDSIPAVLGILPVDMDISDKRFIAFTSNIFAILGLRSMYFALAGFMGYFRFLKPALAFILLFIGVKMILPWAATVGQEPGMIAGWVPEFLKKSGTVHLSTDISLAIVGGVLGLAIAFSVALPKKK